MCSYKYWKASVLKLLYITVWKGLERMLCGVWALIFSPVKCFLYYVNLPLLFFNEVGRGMLWLLKVTFWQWKYRTKCDPNLGYVLPELLYGFNCNGSEKGEMSQLCCRQILWPWSNCLNSLSEILPPLKSRGFLPFIWMGQRYRIWILNC